MDPTLTQLLQEIIDLNLKVAALLKEKETRAKTSEDKEDAKV